MNHFWELSMKQQYDSTKQSSGLQFHWTATSNRAEQLITHSESLLLKFKASSCVLTSTQKLWPNILLKKIKNKIPSPNKPWVWKVGVKARPTLSCRLRTMATRVFVLRGTLVLVSRIWILGILQSEAFVNFTSAVVTTQKTQPNLPDSQSAGN